MKRALGLIVLSTLVFSGVRAQDDNPAPPVIRAIGANQSINCLSNPVALTVEVLGWQSGFTYAWSTGAEDSTITVKPETSTSYQVTVTNNDLGILEVKSFQVNVDNAPILVQNEQIDIDKFTCPGDEIQLVLHPTGGHGSYRYDWSTGSNESSPAVSPFESTVYHAEISDECGTMAEAQVTVVFDAHDPIIASDVKIIEYACGDESLALEADLSSASGGVGHGYSFQFAGLPSDQPLMLKPAAVKRSHYDVRITDACGIQHTTQKIILEKEEIELLTPSTLLACRNQSIDIVNANDGFYFWDGGSMNATYSIQPKRSKNYDVRYIDECGDEQKVQRRVEVEMASLEIDFEIEELDRNLFARFNNADQFERIGWYVNDQLISSDEELELLEVSTDENEIVLEAFSDLGCRYETRREVLFRDGVQIPSAISPNGDDLNESFSVVFEDELAYFQVTIFDRWGQKVFESKDQYFEWSPKSSEMIGPLGTFAYVLEAQTRGGKSIEKTGVLTTINAK